MKSETSFAPNHAPAADRIRVFAATAILAVVGAAAGWRWGTFWSREGPLEVGLIESAMIAISIAGLLTIVLARGHQTLRRCAFYLTNGLILTAIAGVLGGAVGGAIGGALAAALLVSHAFWGARRRHAQS